MNAFLMILKLFFTVAPAVVTTIQTINGDKASGADKKKMAQDALAIASATALSTLTGNNAALASAATALAGAAIDAAVITTKADGSYQAATAASQTAPAA